MKKRVKEQKGPLAKSVNRIQENITIGGKIFYVIPSGSNIQKKESRHSLQILRDAVRSGVFSELDVENENR